MIDKTFWKVATISSEYQDGHKVKFWWWLCSKVLLYFERCFSSSKHLNSLASSCFWGFLKKNA